MSRKEAGRALTKKQEAVIADVVKSVKSGDKFSLTKSVERIYNVKKTSTAAVMATELGKNEDFRTTLLNALENRKILGPDSKVERVLAEGLDAEDKFGTDYKTRLAYVQEINKIAGVYAPEKKESRSFKLNLNMDKEDLDKKIKALQSELEGV